MCAHAPAPCEAFVPHGRGPICIQPGDCTQLASGCGGKTLTPPPLWVLIHKSWAMAQGHWPTGLHRTKASTTSPDQGKTAPLAPRPFFLPARKHSRPQAHSYGPGRAAGRLCSNGLCDISQKLTGSEGETDKPTILKGDFHTLHSVTERTSRQVCKDIEDLNTTVTNQTRFIRINHVLNYETQAL